MFQAGSVVGKMGLDISGWTRSMLEANAISALFPGVVRNFLASPLLGLIGIAQQAANAIKSAFLEIANEADNMGEMAERAGVSVEFLSTVGMVAQDSGSSVAGLADGLKFLNNNMADAASGSKAAIDAFAQIGVNVRDASGQLKSVEAVFYEVTDQIAQMGSTAQKTQAAMNLLGRGGADLIPTMNQGSGEIRRMAQELEDLGGGVSASLARQGDAWGKLMTLASAALHGIKRAAAEPILEYVETHFDEIKKKIKEFADAAKKFIKEDLVPALQQVGNFLKWVWEHWELLLGSAKALLALKITSQLMEWGKAFAGLAQDIARATAAKTGFNGAMAGGGRGVIGAAGVGAGVGSMTGGGGMGANIGGTIGGIGGSLLGSFFGPLGTWIGGSLLGALGGWIGGKFDKSANTQIGQVNVNVQAQSATEEMVKAIQPVLATTMQQEMRWEAGRASNNLVRINL